MSAFRFVQWISEGRPVTALKAAISPLVDDIGRGTIAAIGMGGFEAVNLGSDQPIKQIDCIRLVEELVARKADLRFQPAHRADVDATWANVTKARTCLGGAVGALVSRQRRLGPSDSD